MRDGKAEQNRDQDQPCHQPRDDEIAIELARQRHRRAEHPNQKQDPSRQQGQRTVLSAHGQKHHRERGKSANRCKRQPRKRCSKPRIQNGKEHQRQLRRDPGADHHAHKRVPRSQPQKRGNKNQQAGRDRRLGCGAIDGVIFRPQLQQFMPEAKIDAEIGKHTPRNERGGRKDCLVIGRKDRGEEYAEQTSDPEHNAVEQLTVTHLEAIAGRLPQEQLRAAPGGQLDRIGDGLTWIDGDLKDISDIVFDAFWQKAERRRQSCQTARIQVWPHDARADLGIAFGRDPSRDRLVARVAQSKNDPIGV